MESHGFHIQCSTHTDFWKQACISISQLLLSSTITVMSHYRMTVSIGLIVTVDCTVATLQTEALNVAS